MNALVVFVKAPVPGTVKTRLCPPLEPARAAALYRALARDTVEKAGGLPGARLELAYQPGPGYPDPSWLGGGTPPPWSDQGGGGLGERLERAFERAFSRGAGRVAVIGSDAPHLPAEELCAAFERLEEADVVLGPARDGGYYLIGLRAPRPRLFAGIPWSTSAVLSATLERALELGLSTSLLSPESDVDDSAGLAALARLLQAEPWRAPRTARELGAFPASARAEW